MNKVFLAGSLRASPETGYTPKGQKVVVFPLWIDDGGFAMEVTATADAGPADIDHGRAGMRVLVSGMLTKSGTRPRETFKLRASKILWTEE